MAVRVSACFILLAAPAAGACCPHCIAEKTKARGLSHFSGLHGWQVAEQDWNPEQVWGGGLCCAFEGLQIGGHAT